MSRVLAVFVTVLAVSIGSAVPASAAAVSAEASAAPMARIAGDAASMGSVKTSLAGFTAGNIISDAVFTNRATMTETQIQAFLNSKVTSCRSGYVCLKDLAIATQSKAADKYCAPYAGAARETAARIIYKVAQACNINPQVLIVMLQKEQGLVTHTWPSDWRYNAAMGQACPDTAPCNVAFAGFFAQVYGAARQMQIYMDGVYFTWYAPGKTWNVLYHPNTACGRGSVYIANKATSALYYYTPYQPNAAALAAGYGTGNSCSSYGNRNFYNYFTDWFGSTQNPTARQGLVKVGTSVWLLSGTNRYHVTAEAYPEYKAVLGAPVSVSSSVISAYAEGARGSFYVKNASTGVVAMLQDGKTHRFASCALVARWGGMCGPGLVVLSNALFTKFPVSAEMTSFTRLTSGGRIHQMSGSTLIPLFDTAAARAANGGTTPYASVLPASASAAWTIDPRVRFAPATFIKVSNAPEVWLADESGALRHLPSWAQAAELGLPSSVGVVVSPQDVAAYSRSGTLSSFVQCGSTSYVAASGKLSALKAGAPSGFTSVKLDAQTCAKLQLTGPVVEGPALFMRFSDQPTVYHLADGQYRPVAGAAERVALNGGTEPIVLTAGSAYRGGVHISAPYLTSATFVRVTGTSAVWLVDGYTLIHLPSWQMAAEYGLPSTATVIPASGIEGMAKRDALTPFAVCAGGAYVAAGGQLRAVSAGQTGGARMTELSGQTCRDRVSGSAKDIPVFLGDGKRTAVAVGGGFLVLGDQASVNRAAAGAAIVIHRVSSAYFDRLPNADVPKEGALVRASNQAEVTLINGQLRQVLPNWGVAADLGIQPRYQVVSPVSLATRGIGGSPLSIFVSCGTGTYIGSQGELRAVKASALQGFVPVKLSAATCSTLKISTTPAAESVLLTSAAGKVYSLAQGKLVEEVAGSSAAKTPTVLTLDARTLSGMLKG